MKTLYGIGAMAVVAVGVVWFESTCGETAMADGTKTACCSADAATEKSADEALVCTITDAALMSERVAETRRLMGLAVETVETDAGFKLKFAPEHAADLFEYIQFERACCGFIEFSLTFERGQGAVWLGLSGTAEAKTVIEGMIKD